MKKVNKKYAEIMHQADIAIGRKEVVRLLKKAAKVRSMIDENLAAWSYIDYLKMNRARNIKNSV